MYEYEYLHATYICIYVRICLNVYRVTYNEPTVVAVYRGVCGLNWEIGGVCVCFSEWVKPGSLHIFRP